MAMALFRRRGASIIKSIPSFSSSCHLSRCVRPVAVLTEFTNRFPSTTPPIFTATLKCMSTTTSSQPKWKPIFDDGCDFEHWLIVMEKPQEEATRDEIIDSYIKTLSKLLGSEAEARMKIYSVSTRCYFAFGALVSEELAKKIPDLPGVRWVVPDSYKDITNKTYPGEPFINGKAVP